MLNNKCFSYGTRTNISSYRVYCPEQGRPNWLLQRSTGSYCKQDHECETNLCEKGLCTEASKICEVGERGCVNDNLE